MTALRYVAPAGAPIGLLDLATAARLSVSGRGSEEVLRGAVLERFGVDHCFLTSTGRAGMTLLLKALRRLSPPDRDEVILPSYTCFSVAASVVKAGLRPRIVDISTETLDYAPDRLRGADLTRALAIVATNLYGLPNDLAALSELARQRGVFLIDDAAQAMGASVNGRWSGTWGDAGLFSLDKGKNVSAIDGGLVVTNRTDVASALAREMADLPPATLAESAAGVMKAVAYSLLLRPRLYWIPARIPQLGLGRTVFTTDFPLERPSRPLVALAATMFARLDEFTQVRQRNAAALLTGLRAVAGVRAITPTASSVPVYLRLPILVEDETARDHVLAALNGAGIGATGSYPASLADVAPLRAAAGGPMPPAKAGQYVARHIVTLPTHAFVSASDVERSIAAIVAALDGAGARKASPAA